MRWRGKRQRARPEGSPQRLLAVVGLRTLRTLVHVVGERHVADDVQFPIEIRVKQLLCLVTVHGRPVLSQSCFFESLGVCKSLNS